MEQCLILTLVVLAAALLPLGVAVAFRELRRAWSVQRAGRSSSLALSRLP